MTLTGSRQGDAINETGPRKRVISRVELKWIIIRRFVVISNNPLAWHGVGFSLCARPSYPTRCLLTLT